MLTSLAKARGYETDRLLETIGSPKEASIVNKRTLQEGVSNLSAGLKPREVSDIVDTLLDGQEYLDREKLQDLVDIQQGNNRSYRGVYSNFGRVREE